MSVPAKTLDTTPEKAQQSKRVTKVNPMVKTRRQFLKTQADTEIQQYTNKAQVLLLQGRRKRDVISQRSESLMAISDGVYGEANQILGQSLRTRMEKWLNPLHAGFGHKRNLGVVDLVDVGFEGTEAFDIRVADNYDVTFPNISHSLVQSSPLAPFLKVILSRLDSFHQATVQKDVQPRQKTTFKGQDLQILIKSQKRTHIWKAFSDQYHVSGDCNQAVQLSANYVVKQTGITPAIGLQTIEEGNTLNEKAQKDNQLWVVDNSQVVHKVDKLGGQDGESLVFSVWLVDPSQRLPSMTDAIIEANFPADQLVRAQCRSLLENSLFSDEEEVA